MKKKFLLTIMAMICALFCALALSACDGGDNTVEVESITLNKTSLPLEVGGTETLTATVKPDDATNKTVTWSSDNTAVATVDSTGKVTAKAEGTAKITATAGKQKAECTVTVNTPDVKMSETEWKTSITAFVNAKNLSLKQSLSEASEVVAYEMKLDGTTFYDIVSSSERTYIKDGSNYYRYNKFSDETYWIKTEITEEEYNNSVNGSTSQIVAGASQVFSNNYSSFEYADGKYTAESIAVTSESTLKDIEITVKDNALEKIVCTYVSNGDDPDMLITIDNIGTTEIPLPKVQEPAKGLKYRIPTNKNYAVVTGLTLSQDMELDIMIAAEYQGKPVTTIASNALSNTPITSVIIPDSVTTIEGSAFKDSKSLAKITIPDSVKEIEGSAFKNTAWYDSQPDGVVYAGKVAYEYKGDKNSIKTVTIKDGTYSISPVAFYQCEQLTTVSIPDSVKIIGNNAFDQCIRLETVSLGKGVERIGSYAFQDCKLTNIVLPDSVTDIRLCAFKGSTLTSITIGSGVQNIENQVFEGCPNITITYHGTKEQWEAIKKSQYWNASVDDSTIKGTIKCTNGDIVLN